MFRPVSWLLGLLGAFSAVLDDLSEDGLRIWQAGDRRWWCAYHGQEVSAEGLGSALQLLLVEVVEVSR